MYTINKRPAGGATTLSITALRKIDTLHNGSVVKLIVIYAQCHVGCVS
jgi:hypothetical protein